MAESPVAGRISDSHKNAFWIWGVTAMIMREPLGLVVRRLSTDGIADPSVQLLFLRTVLTLLILSRQFLTAGVYFDRVYMRPDSHQRFPRRSYPLDFLTRLMELLVAVAASASVAAEGAGSGAPSPFLILTVILLLAESVWWLMARVAGFSTAPEIAPAARNDLLTLFASFVLAGSMHGAGIWPGRFEAVLLAAVALLTAVHLANQVRAYDQP